MKNLVKIFVFLVIAGFIASCTVIEPVTATSNSIGEKVGKSSTVAISQSFVSSPNSLGVGINFDSDFSVVQAVRNGDIDKVSTVDMKITSYGFIVKKEIIVTGK